VERVEEEDERADLERCQQLPLSGGGRRRQDSLLLHRLRLPEPIRR
jgi:hypothetical protein